MKEADGIRRAKHHHSLYIGVRSLPTWMLCAVKDMLGQLKQHGSLQSLQRSSAKRTVISPPCVRVGVACLLPECCTRSTPRLSILLGSARLREE